MYTLVQHLNLKGNVSEVNSFLTRKRILDARKKKIIPTIGSVRRFVFFFLSELRSVHGASLCKLSPLTNPRTDKLRE